MHKLNKCSEPPAFTQAKQEYVQDSPPCGSREGGRWEEFKSAYQAEYGEIRKALLDNQNGLCAFCETVLTENDQQVDHFKPKMYTTQHDDLTFDFANYLLCCKGGTQSKGHANHSCGEAKGNTDPTGCILHPSDFPQFPIFNKVSVRPDFGEKSYVPDLDGVYFGINTDACSQVDIDVAMAGTTIKHLNLNNKGLAVRRLEVWDGLEKEVEDVIANKGPTEQDEALQRLLEFYLTPDNQGQLNKFYTTMVLFFAGYFPEIMESKAWENGALCPTL